MNDIIQNILVFSALALALLFLVKKFVWSSKKKTDKAGCSDDGCGCG
jgi:hypothetical protein